NIHENISVLQQHYSLPLDNRLAIQRQRLVQLLNYTTKHVPYYLAILSSTNALDASGEFDISQFQSLPFLTKDIIRERFDALKSEDLSLRRWYFNSTGGSTGEPLRFVQDQTFSDFS